MIMLLFYFIYLINRVESLINLTKSPINKIVYMYIVFIPFPIDNPIMGPLSLSLRFWTPIKVKMVINMWIFSFLIQLREFFFLITSKFLYSHVTKRITIFLFRIFSGTTQIFWLNLRWEKSILIMTIFSISVKNCFLSCIFPMS